MSAQRILKKIVRTVISEDIRIIGIFVLLILSLTFGYNLFMGYMAPYGLVFNTPANDVVTRLYYEDSDNDLLVDKIELGTAGEPIYDGDTYLGIGTGTDPYDKDTDGDLFTDGAENNFGSDPNSWINPGFVWLIWLSAIVFWFVSRQKKEDMLKEYKEFEETRVSGGVSGKGGKFAYGSSSVFGKPVSEMNAEEKRKIIEQDGRYQRMMGLSEPEPVKIKSNRMTIIVQILVSILITIIIRYAIVNWN